MGSKTSVRLLYGALGAWAAWRAQRRLASVPLAQVLDDLASVRWPAFRGTAWEALAVANRVAALLVRLRLSRSSCLSRSLALFWLLRGRPGVVFHVGLHSRPRGPVGHAWVSLEGQTLDTGGERRWREVVTLRARSSG